MSIQLCPSTWWLILLFLLGAVLAPARALSGTTHLAAGVADAKGFIVVSGGSNLIEQIGVTLQYLEQFHQS